MHPKIRILVIGSADMSLYLTADKLPGAGELIKQDGSVAYVPGGVGAEIAVAIAKLGEEAVLCSKLGADMHGQKLYNYYKDAGVNTACLKVDHERSTGLSVYVREGDSDYGKIIYSGANGHISAEALADAFQCEPHAVLLSLELPSATVLTAAKMAAAKGIPIIVDMAGADAPGELDNMPEAELLLVNEKQAQAYTGVAPVGMEASLRTSLALGRLIKSKNIVIKLGSRGVFIYDGKRYGTAPSYRPEKIVDESGAGCAFAAALVTEYLYNGGDVKSAVKYGCAAAAVALARPGASASAPSALEIEEFLSALNK